MLMWLFRTPLLTGLKVSDAAPLLKHSANRCIPGPRQLQISTGYLEAGVPDVSCAGNINMGPDAVWFGNTDASPHNDVSDLVELVSR